MNRVDSQKVPVVLPYSAATSEVKEKKNSQREKKERDSKPNHSINVV